jgi:gliding motility-associated-like protein
MKRIKLLLFSVLVLLLQTTVIKAQGGSCPGTPFCAATGSPFSYPNDHSGATGQVGPSYGCLCSEPNPNWFYVKSTAAGNMVFTISQSSGDVDFCAWGPFTAAGFANACNNLNGACSGGCSTTVNPPCSGGIVDCSYSINATENMTLPATAPGQYFIIMITNYAGTAGTITLTQNSGQPSDCSITCNPTSITMSGQDAATQANIPSGSTIPCGSPFWVDPVQPAFTDPTTDILTPCLMVDYNLFNTNENTNGNLTLYEAGSPYGPTPYQLCNGCSQGTIGGAVGTTGVELNSYLSFLDSAVAHPVVFCNTSTVGTTTVSLKNCWDGTVYAGPVVWNTSTASCFTLTAPATAHLGSAIYSINPAGGGSGVFDYHDGNAYVDPNLIAAGTYTLTYTFHGRDGCAPGIGTYVFTVPAKPVVTVTPSATTICSGSSTSLTGGGANTYTWSTGSSSNPLSVSPGTTTVYTVTGTNTVTACKNTATATVTVVATPTVTTSGNLSICNGSSTTLSVSATPASTFSWSVGSTSSSISVSPSTPGANYTVIATNGICSTSKTMSVTVTATPTLTVAGNTVCSGQSVVLTNTGAGSGSNTYTWSPTGGSANSATVSPTVNTTYTLTAANGACTKTTTATITVTATPTLSVAGGTVCSGQNVVLTNTGAGSGSNTYTWSPSGGSANSATVSPTSNTTYTLNAANGACTASTTAAVTVTASPTLTVAGGTLCSGQSIVLTNTGAGSGSNTYTWSPTGGSATSATVSPTANTTYTLTAANGACTKTTTATVTVTATPTLSVAGNTVCSGQSVVLTNTGAGSGSNTYTWSPTGGSATSATVSPTANTTYTLTAANGACTKTTTATVTVTPTPTLAVAGGAICSSQSIVLTNTGTGSGSNTYTWSPSGGSANSATVSPTSNTTYTLNAANGVCTASTTAAVTVTPTPTVSITGNTNICSGNSTVLTGASAANYSWNPGGATTNTITVSPGAGATNYTLTGYNGVCTASTVATVSVTATPTVSISGNNDICSGQSEVLTGATATNFTWSPGAVTTNTISVNPGTSTNYTLVGANGTCTSTAIASVSVTPTPTITISGVAPICTGGSLVLTGATATSYTWSSGGISTNTITVNPTTGTVTTTTDYTLTGANGTCTSSAVATVTVNPLPIIGSASVTAAPCGQSTGCINNVPITGGAPTYSYSWNGGTTYSSSSTNCNIPAGTYPLQVMDANGCISNSNISVPSLSGPTAPTATVSSSSTCLGDSAVFTITPAGSFTYTWTDYTGTHTGTTYTISNITPAGTYSVSVTSTDASGCLSSATTMTVNVNSLPPSAVSGTSHFCKGTSTVLNASPSGAGYSYQWSMGGTPIGGATGATYNANAAGNYGVVITDLSTNCKAPSVGNYTVTIDSLPKIDTTGMVITNSNCTSATGSVINVTVTPSAGDSYSWTNASGTVVGNTINLGSVPAGNYCLLVTTSPATNCRDSICGVTINNAGAPPVPTLTTPNNTYCFGQTQSPITVSGTGTFSWYSDPGLTTQIATGTTYSPTPNVVVTTTLYVTATNAGCQSASTPVVITINPNPTAPVISGSASNPLIECQNSTAQSVSVATTGSVTSVPVWYNGGTYVTTGTSYTPSTATPGTTVYTITDSATVTGCKDMSAGNVLTVTVTINATPTGPTISGSASNPMIECQNSIAQTASVATTGSVTSVPVWYNGSGYVTTGNSYTPSTATPGTTVYTIIDSATVAGGCTSATTGSVLTITVTINSTPVNPTVSSPGITICSGQSAGTFTATGSAGGNIIWSTSPTMNPVVHVGTTYTPTNTATTVYYIEDSTSAGCKSAAAATSVTVTINPSPTITGTPAFDTSKCGSNSGAVLNLTGAGGTPAYTYQWIDSTGAVIGTASDLTNVGPGSYSLIVTDANGCKDTSNTKYTVIGSASINASFTPSTTSGQAPLNVVFANTSTGAAAYAWTFDGTATSTITNPSYTYNTNGTYTVMLIASNGSCIDTAYSVIIIDVATTIVIPNIFSPNGDGLNDEFIIACTGMKTLTCDIFNRWGQLVATLTGPNQNWDGRLNNGNMATEGTYYFMLNATGADGKSYSYQGPLTLVK